MNFPDLIKGTDKPEGVFSDVPFSPLPGVAPITTIEVGEEVELRGYENQDDINWVAGNPIGVVMTFHNVLDDATVICTEHSFINMFWRFVTVESDEDHGHPVSGFREFGMEETNNGTYIYYVRAADRLTSHVDGFVADLINDKDDFFFAAADETWTTMMKDVKQFIEDKGGEVEPFDDTKEYAKRYPFNEDDCE